MSIEQLLTHAAGTQAETHGPWWERTPGGDWDALVASAIGQRFRAGRRFHYSNVGYAALGRLLEVHHGGGWFDVVRDELLEPLGMTRTTTRPSGSAALGLAVHPFADVLLPEPEHDGGAMAPAGQLWTTVPDLARWAAFLGGATGDVLSADTLAEMVEPHHVVDDPGQPWVAAHGLGFQVWNVGGARFAGHGGSMPGFLAGLRVRLDAGVRQTGDRRPLGAAGDGVVLFTNTTASTSDSLDHRRPARRAGPPRAGPGAAVVGERRPGAARAGRHLALGALDGHRHASPVSTSCWASRAAGAGPASGRPGSTRGSGWTATTRANPWTWCAGPTARCRTSTSRRSASPARRTTRRPTCRAGSTRTAGLTHIDRDPSLRAVVQHLVQPGGERLGLARIAVLATEEAAVVAGELGERPAQGPGEDGSDPAGQHLA